MIFFVEEMWAWFLSNVSLFGDVSEMRPVSANREGIGDLPAGRVGYRRASLRRLCSQFLHNSVVQAGSVDKVVHFGDDKIFRCVKISKITHITYMHYLESLYFFLNVFVFRSYIHGEF